MKNFLKDNGYIIFKMMVNQLGMTMFGLMLSLATAQNDTLFLITSIFSVLFYMFLLYTMTWEDGFKEKVRIDSKRVKYSPLKGLWMSLCANIINFILAAVILIGYLCVTDMAAKSPEWAYNMYGVGKYIATVVEAMYAGLIGIYMPNNPLAYLLIIFPAVAVCTLGYYLGVKEVKLFGMGGKKNK